MGNGRSFRRKNIKGAPNKSRRRQATRARKRAAISRAAQAASESFVKSVDLSGFTEQLNALQALNARPHPKSGPLIALDPDEDVRPD